MNSVGAIKHEVFLINPLGNNVNPLSNQIYSNNYKKEPKWWTELPVYQDKEKIIKLIKDNQVILLVSGTGSGKSVLIPFYALHATNYKGKIVMTIPKRGAVVKAAKTAANISNIELGKEIGYQYRGSRLPNGRASKSSQTKLLISTDGSVVAQLINDPELKSYDVVIVDEAHERGIQIDLLLLLMKKALKLNPDLKLIIMSATINPEIFANYFKHDFKYHFIEVSGALTNYPVDINYLPTELKNAERDFVNTAVDRMVKLLEETDSGDIIFFVNSANEAIQSCDKLRIKVKEKKLDKPFCIELSGGSDLDTQNYAVNEFKYRNHPNGPFSRKIIIATNAAESSLTFKGLVYIIDSGWAYVASYDPLKMENRLLQERISKAQATQRTGRFGRTKPGTCYRLYTEKEFKNFIDYPVVDIRKSDITDDILRFMKLPYVNNISDLLKLLKELIEPPYDNFIKSGLYRLYAIGALDKIGAEGKLTDLGHKILKFRKLDPLMVKAVIESYYYRTEYDMITLAALLNKADGRMNTFIKDLKLRQGDRGYREEKQRYDRAKKKYTSANGDIITLLKMYKLFREYSDTHQPEETKRWCRDNYLKYDRLKDIKRAAQDIMKEVQDILFPREKFVNKLEENQYIYDYDKDQQTGGTLNRKIVNKMWKKGGNTIDEDAIMSSLIQGLFINMAKRVGNNYKNCFPFEKTSAPIARDSELSVTKSGPKFIVYMELANILGRRKFNLVSKVSETIVKKLDNKQKMMIETCFKKEKETNRRNNRGNDRKRSFNDRKRSFKDRYKNRFKKSRSFRGKRSRRRRRR